MFLKVRAPGPAMYSNAGQSLDVTMEGVEDRPSINNTICSLPLRITAPASSKEKIGQGLLGPRPTLAWPTWALAPFGPGPLPLGPGPIWLWPTGARAHVGPSASGPGPHFEFVHQHQKTMSPFFQKEFEIDAATAISCRWEV